MDVFQLITLVGISILITTIVHDMSKICEMFLKLNLYLIKYGTILKIITCLKTVGIMLYFRRREKNRWKK